MSTELANGAEIEPLSNGHGDTEVPEADKPLLHGEQTDVVKVDSYESELPESGVRDTASESASLAEVKPHLVPTGETEVEQLSSDHEDSEVSESHSDQTDPVIAENYESELPQSDVREITSKSASLTDVPTGETEVEQLSSDHGDGEVDESHNEQTDPVNAENNESELPESDVRDTASLSASLTDVKPHLAPIGETEFEQLSCGHGDSEIPEANKPLLHNEQADFVKADMYETKPHESDVCDTSFQSTSLGDVKPNLTPTSKVEFEQLSSGRNKSEVSEADKSLLHIEQADICKVEYYESELPESDVRDTALQSAGLADDKPYLSPTGKEEFEQLSSASVYGDSEVSEADKPLLYIELADICKVESYGSELLVSDVGVTAPLSASLADVMSHLVPTGRTDTSYAKNVDPENSFGMVCIMQEI